MPKQKEWMVLVDFTYVPRPNVVCAFKAGQVVKGLTRACRDAAGDRIEEIKPE